MILRYVALFFLGYNMGIVYDERRARWHFWLMLPGTNEEVLNDFTENEFYLFLVLLGLRQRGLKLRLYIAMLELTIVLYKTPTQPIERASEHLRRRQVLFRKGYSLQIEYGYGYVPVAHYSFPDSHGAIFLKGGDLKEELMYLFFEHSDPNDRRYFVELMELEKERLEAEENSQLTGILEDTLENAKYFIS
jgi:hypothetical protein